MTAKNLLFGIGLSISATTAFAAKTRTSEPITPIKAPVKVNKQEVELGKKLFFETRLSKSGFISCNSCHNLATGGADNMKSSVGHGWQLGPINSPTVLNSSYNLAQFWDGRAKDLVDQAGGPIANPGEMASTHGLAVKVLNSIPEYREEFKRVYGSSTIKIAAVQKAIAAFETTLVTPNSRFDQWLEGDDKALTKNELQGYQHFKDFGCTACHNGPAVGGNQFQKFGLIHPYAKDTKTLGRFAVTKNEADKYVFKVPTLRNVELTAPYFHDGETWSLEEAVETMAWHQLGLKPKKTEVKSIVAFLKTLTGDQPQVVLPILPPSTSKTPKPNQSFGEEKSPVDSH